MKLTARGVYHDAIGSWSFQLVMADKAKVALITWMMGFL
jgi:hypothetical protein